MVREGLPGHRCDRFLLQLVFLLTLKQLTFLHGHQSQLPRVVSPGSLPSSCTTWRSLDSLGYLIFAQNRTKKRGRPGRMKALDSDGRTAIWTCTTSLVKLPFVVLSFYFLNGFTFEAK